MFLEILDVFFAHTSRAKKEAGGTNSDHRHHHRKGLSDEQVEIYLGLQDVVTC
jgi:hypothetical protein